MSTRGVPSTSFGSRQEGKEGISMIDKNDYCTMSATGVTHLRDGEAGMYIYYESTPASDEHNVMTL